MCRGVANALAQRPATIRLLVTAGPSTPKQGADGEPATKSGIHVHFQLACDPSGKRAMIVDSDSGLHIRSSVLKELYQDLGTEDKGLDWLAIIDRSLMVQNGWVPCRAAGWLACMLPVCSAVRLPAAGCACCIR